MIRRALGGTLRQAGVIAAQGLVSLRTGIDRLAEDHQNARTFAEGVAGENDLFIDLDSVQSNIVNLDVGGLGVDAATFAHHLNEKGVRGLPGLGTVVRFVTYRGITEAGIEKAVAAVREVASVRPWTLTAV